MSKRFICLLITLLMIGMLAGCSKNGQQTATTTGTPETAKKVESAPEAVTTENKTEVAGTNIKINQVAGDEVVLPQDIPVYPNAELTGKRITNRIQIFDYRAKAKLADVTSFYDAELKKQNWRRELQQPNSTDGVLYSKDGKTVKLVAINNAKDQTCDIHLFLVEGLKAAKTDEIKDAEGRQQIGNIKDYLGNIPRTIPDDVPLYPNMERKTSIHPQMWKEFRSQESVATLSSWYEQKMKENGWTREHQTDEMGDTMRFYNKDDGKGNLRKIAIRVNDMKQEKERWLTVILLPDNVTIPKVLPMTEVQKLKTTNPAEYQKQKELYERIQKEGTTIPSVK